MFSPFLEVWGRLKSKAPRNLSIKKKLNFVSIHCSLLILSNPIGLTRVDLNKIKTFQQVGFVRTIFKRCRSESDCSQMVIYSIAMVANPIFISTAVVFVRLYSFERRFQNIAKEARSYRRTRSRAKSETKDEGDPELMERGVRGRNIVVLRENQNATAVTSDSSPPPAPEKESLVQQRANGNSSGSPESRDGGSGDAAPDPVFEKHRDIQFADLQAPERWNSSQRRGTEQHIEFLESQRNPKDKEALRIPGPRDFDRGQVPHKVEDGEGSPLSRTVSTATQPDKLGSNSGEKSDRIDQMSEFNDDDNTPKRTITIDEPSGHASRATAGPFSKAKLRRPSNVSLPRIPSIGSAVEGFRSRARSTTSNSKTELDRFPYLSYTPTIGRNSIFINLTQEQRDELGGIEYRSLKTLAIILVCKFSS
ncbi:hypothetical protein GP486_002757 [Trichoglossum hirsutum]|uniref:Uncharacterized protein n=1 Tax=Trichoglossum hirsutum TaxID=265104 RepID=A0A9P8LEH1_9PEZI|nr:hypothetical protein GP486_002757 [Trichoglossum hirsutum]